MHYLMYLYWKVLATHGSFEQINEFTRGKRETADKTEKKILYSGGDFSPSTNILYKRILNLGRGLFIHLAF